MLQELAVEHKMRCFGDDKTERAVAVRNAYSGRKSGMRSGGMPGLRTGFSLHRPCESAVESAEYLCYVTSYGAAAQCTRSMHFPSK